jgi:hypothetical protein
MGELLHELRQGEVITHVAQYIYDPVGGRAAESYQDYVIVGTQDCDLLWDYKAMQQGKEGDLNGLILYEAEDALKMKARFGGKQHEDIWKRIIQNREDRYHYFEAIPPDLDLVSEGVSALVVDFKRYFTMPPPELYRQCGLGHGARRRCRLNDLYREHFQNRVATYIQRVGLPRNHRRPTEPSPMPLR